MYYWVPTTVSKHLVSKIEDLDVPLLTTNYDNILRFDEKSNDMMKCKFIGKNRINEEDYHAGCIEDYDKNVNEFIDESYHQNIHSNINKSWNYYFSNKELTSSIAGFGVWNIHGSIEHSKSIVIGSNDYQDCIRSADKMIASLYKDDDTNKYAWNNTWLNILFNKSLFIFGLSLDENEIFLRHLLEERSKYYFLNPDKKQKGWYVTVEPVSEGKRLFLKNYGFEILEVENYKVIYEDIWENL